LPIFLCVVFPRYARKNHTHLKSNVPLCRRLKAPTAYIQYTIGNRRSTRGATMLEDLTIYLHQVAQTLSQLPHQPLDRIAEALWTTYERDGTILICGNGGSAASASHFACDMAKLTISADCRRVRALALTDNIPLITAWSNDQA
jgi:hypothetical protein